MALLTDDPARLGTFIIDGDALIEDPARPGTFIVAGKVAGVTSATAYRSALWSTSETHSLRVPPGETATVAPTGASTAVIVARNIGQQMTVDAITVTSVAADETLRAEGATLVTLGEGWWDDFTIVAGSYAGLPFSGSSAPDGGPGYVYEWSGSADTSRSTATKLVETPIVYDPATQERAAGVALVHATTPGAVYLVMLEDDVPTWGGLIARRTRGKGDTVAIDMGTPATYLRRRFVGDVTYTDVDQCAIVQALVVAYGAASGLPFGYDVSASAFLRDRSYLDVNDKTLGSVMSELASVENGPEWMVGWVASTVGGQRAYCPLLIVRDRLGTTPSPGMDPAVTWEYPGPVTDFTLIEDYGDGSGANDVLAVSSAVSDARPQSLHTITLNDDRPRFELRFTPSTSITNTGTLDSHAASKLAIVGQGSRSLALSLIGEGNRPGIDFNMGDVRGFGIGGDSHPMLAYPGGLGGTGRIVGWSRTLTGVQQVTPVLADLVVTHGRW